MSCALTGTSALRPRRTIDAQLEAFRRRAGARWVTWMEVGRGRDGLRSGQIRSTQDVVPPAGRPVRPTEASATCPSRSATASFERLPHEELTAWSEWLDPSPKTTLRSVELVRAAVVSPPHVLGWLVLALPRAAEPAALRRLRSSARELVDHLRQEAALPDLVPVDTQYLVLAQGRVQFSTPTCHRLIGRQDVGRLLAGCGRDPVMHLDRADVEFVPMHGPAEDAWMGCVHPLRPVALSPAHVLTQAQKRVAERAARGETLLEIADRLGIQHETARCHLREAYRRLSVSNRVELSTAIGTQPQTPAPKPSRYAVNA
jgi:DNA-binding CsgD family transcriptional regulator